MTQISISLLLNLMCALVFIMIVNITIQNKIKDIEIANNDTYGWLRFFYYLSGGILLQNLSNAIELISIRNKINAESSIGNYFIYGGSYIIIAIIVWFIIQIIASSAQKSIFNNKSLAEAIQNDNKSYLLSYCGIMIMLSIIFNPIILKITEAMIPTSSVPFYH